MPVGRLFADDNRPVTALSDINILKLDGAQTTVEKAVLKELADSLSGHIVLPTSEGYDDARKLWNGMIDKRPALIVQCLSPQDVQQAVNLAREYELLTAVRGGGHNIAGKGSCDGGLQINCSTMTQVSVNPDERWATAEPGVLLGAVDRGTQPYGLATPAGVVSHTGAAGLTLGGGFGKLSRRYGLTCDNVLWFDIVLPSGELKRVSAESDPDLFWALRGGGGNFGVVTKFAYQLHDVGTDFLSGVAMHPIKNAKDVWNFYVDFMAGADKDLQVSCSGISMPNGKGFVNISIFYGGDPKDGEKAIEPLLNFGNPMRTDFGVKKYLKIQSQTDRNVPHGQQYYQKAGFMSEVDSGLINTLVDITKNPKPFTQTMNFTQVGGQINEVDTAATAYANRNAEAQLVFGGGWPKPVEGQEDWIELIRADWENVYPYTDGFYTNNEMADDSDNDKKVVSNYGENYDRLVKIKNEIDPMNLFRLNSNVKPTV
jgi:hypothetical protein